MRKVSQIMGMPISIDIPDCRDSSVFETAYERLRQIDERFSTYKPASEVSRFAAEKIKESDLSDELKIIIKACRKAESETGGYFSAWASGQFDPSGYVKGWAIEQAAKAVEKQGYKTFCIGAGGDILARSAGGKIWNIGIQDPRQKGRILDVLSISSGAVATSGNYERGEHIINPKTGRPAQGILSVTVTGADIIQADVLATACFAMGSMAKEFMKSKKDYTALII